MALAFSKDSSAIVKIMARRGFKIVSYLDDFLVTETTFKKCAAAMQALITLSILLGFAVKWDKLQGPCPRVKFLGIILDSESKTLELPADQMDRLSDMALQLLLRTKITKKDLQFIGTHTIRREIALRGSNLLAIDLRRYVFPSRAAPPFTRIKKLINGIQVVGTNRSWHKWHDKMSAWAPPNASNNNNERLSFWIWCNLWEERNCWPLRRTLLTTKKLSAGGLLDSYSTSQFHHFLQ